jgi:hypothetical protein
LALGRLAFSVLVLALFAISLWCGWLANHGTLRIFVQTEDTQALEDIFGRQGAGGNAIRPDAAQFADDGGQSHAARA